MFNLSLPGAIGKFALSIVRSRVDQKKLLLREDKIMHDCIVVWTPFLMFMHRRCKHPSRAFNSTRGIGHMQKLRPIWRTSSHAPLFECESNTGLSSWKKHTLSLSRKIQRGSSKQICHRNGRRYCSSCSQSKHVKRSLHHTNKPMGLWSHIAYVQEHVFESTVVPKNSITV